MDALEPYRITLLVLGLTGLLYWVQMAVADYAGIRAGHTPGFAIAQSHGNFLFRATRAIGNSNESVGVFLLCSLFAMLSSANAAWLNGLAMVYLASRVSHMVFYYANLQLLRSIVFGIGFVCLPGIFLAGLIAWL